jgi:uncharacterized protein (TIGR03000 family)
LLAVSLTVLAAGGVILASRSGSAQEDATGGPAGAPRYTVGHSEGHNLIVTDNRTGNLYFYTADKDKPVGSDLKLRGEVNLGSAGKLAIRPKGSGEATGGGKTAARGGKAPATITLIVRADAEVLIEGDRTTQSGAERTFLTPALPKGQRFSYDVVVRWREGGKVVERKHKVEVSGGARVRADLTGK